MPELPEVEVVRRGLLPLVGAAVEAVEVLDERALRRHVPGAADFEARLTGATFGEPTRRGKFLWVPLVRDPLRLAALAQGPSDPVAEGPSIPAAERAEGETKRSPRDALLVHLGMSGQLLIDDEWRPHRHERVRIALGGRILVFADQRTFGSLALDPLIGPDGSAVVPSQVAHIALDPLDPAFDLRAVVRRMRTRRTELKRALLDQTLVSGIGNIYADEALWAARLHPRQPTATLSAQAARRILEESRHVMERALAEGGTSFDSLYVNVNGQSGYFSRSLQAYGRDGEPCPRCGRAIVRETFTNRSSHFCPRCQRLG